MQPSAASTSRLSQRSDCEKALAERTQPGAAWKSSTASGDGLPPRMSHVLSHSGRESACTACTSWLSRPARCSSPRIAGIPPARCTSSMRYVPLGATLHTHGTRRDSCSMSCSVKSSSASWAAASRCRIVLVEPPIAMSSDIAFSKAARPAMARGSTVTSSWP